MYEGSVLQHASIVMLSFLSRARPDAQGPGALTADMEAAVARMTHEAERAGVPADRARRAAIATQLVAASLAGVTAVPAVRVRTPCAESSKSGCICRTLMPPCYTARSSFWHRMSASTARLPGDQHLHKALRLQYICQMNRQTATLGC